MLTGTMTRIYTEIQTKEAILRNMLSETKSKPCQSKGSWKDTTQNVLNKCVLVQSDDVEDDDNEVNRKLTMRKTQTTHVQEQARANKR